MGWTRDPGWDGHGMDQSSTGWDGCGQPWDGPEFHGSLDTLGRPMRLAGVTASPVIPVEDTSLLTGLAIAACKSYGMALCRG